MKLSELAAQTFSTIENGSPNLEIKAAAGLDIASEGDVTFLANPKYTPQIAITKATAIFLDEKTETGRGDLVVLRARDPYVAYTRALRLFHPEPELRPFRHPTAVIDETAEVDERTEIGAHVVIGRQCRIAAGVRVNRIANGIVL